MKKLLILLFSMLISFNSYGEWTEVGSSSSGNYYLDLDIIKKSGGYVYFWHLEDLLEPDSTNILSTKTYKKGDCSINGHIILSNSFYEQPMGQGNARKTFGPSNEWSYPAPGTVAAGLLDIACDYLN